MPTAKAVARLLFPYRESLKTITTDNGCGFAAHLEITKRLSMKGWEKVIVYFADTYCSWQKGHRKCEQAHLKAHTQRGGL